MSKAPYGRFGKSNKLVSLDPRLGWWLMELPATVCFLYGFFKKENKEKKNNYKVRTVLFLLWMRHYANRGWYFPLTIRVAQGGTNSFALFNSLVGAVFVGIHGYLNGRMFSDVGNYTNAWLKDPRFLLGLLLYETGFWTTLHSESVLRNLRPANKVIPSGERYKIPYGGMFKYVTNPQYLGEITAWCGFLILTWSPTALPVVLITLANLVPRSFENHKWYLEKFKDYPADRKAIIPFVI
mmetsp:Transcript_27296/g.43876  ORF Transcript_27296/g.43876 Transcript_27296/m.43876 type:complete len:239 (+) Transcript_27296:138-854(+)